MATPRREDQWTVIDDLRRRIDRLEQLNAQRASLLIVSSVPPDPPSNGALLYVEAGVTKVVGQGGTRTTIALS